MKLDLCPMCNKKIILTPNNESRTFVIQKQKIELDDKFYRCPHCKEEWSIEGFDVLETAYDIYKEKNGMITTEQVLNMTSEQLDKAKNLGISLECLERYKKGCLQTKEHDDILRQAILNISKETLISIDNSIHSDSLGIVGKSFDPKDFQGLFNEEEN